MTLSEKQLEQLFDDLTDTYTRDYLENLVFKTALEDDELFKESYELESRAKICGFLSFAFLAVTAILLFAFDSEIAFLTGVLGLVLGATSPSLKRKAEQKRIEVGNEFRSNAGSILQELKDKRDAKKAAKEAEAAALEEEARVAAAAMEEEAKVEIADALAEDSVSNIVAAVRALKPGVDNSPMMTMVDDELKNLLQDEHAIAAIMGNPDKLEEITMAREIIENDFDADPFIKRRFKKLLDDNVT